MLSDRMKEKTGRTGLRGQIVLLEEGNQPVIAWHGEETGQDGIAFVRAE